MSYVDLNPVRAKIADRPEESDFTSIQDRIRHYQKAVEQTGNCVEAAISAPAHLEPFVGGEHQDKTSGLNFSLPGYLVGHAVNNVTIRGHLIRLIGFSHYLSLTETTRWGFVSLFPNGACPDNHC